MTKLAAVGKPQLVSKTMRLAERKGFYFFSQNLLSIVVNKIFLSVHKTDEAKTYRGLLF